MATNGRICRFESPMADEVEFVVGSVSPLTVHFASLSDLDSVPDSAGWYAWFYIPSSLNPEHFQLYRHTRVDSTVTGIFNLTFEGRLKSRGGDAVTGSGLKKPQTSLELLRSLFLAFAPPLYVGISKGLRRRLKAHRKTLSEFMAGAGAAGELKTGTSVEPDTERESQFFGARIGAALRTLRISADDLHVKCVLAETPSEMKEIEQVLNYALTPHYGRR